MLNQYRITATYDQLAKLSEVLQTFMTSENEFDFECTDWTIEIDDNPAIYEGEPGSGEALCYSVVVEGID